MKRFWPYLYLSLTAVVFLSNTGLFFKENFGDTNVDWFFIALSFSVGLFYPSMVIVYAHNRVGGALPRPSLLRGFAGGWWTDPWQCVLLTTFLTCGWFLGSLFTLPSTNHQAVMVIWWKAALAFGSVGGFALALKRHLGKTT